LPGWQHLVLSMNAAVRCAHPLLHWYPFLLLDF